MPDQEVDDISRRVSVSQAMLDRVIHTTDNLDEKVGRIFTSMSFLMTGSTILFTSFLANKLLFPVDGVPLVPLLFLGFMLSVAVATGYMLQAMGPRFSLFSRAGREWAGMKALTPSPTGYADKIASMQESEWKGYFEGVQSSELYQKWFSESLEEVYVLSKKVSRKVAEMRRAQQAFVLALFFLTLMVIAAVYQLAA